MMYGWIIAPVVVLAVFTYGGLDIGPFVLLGVGILGMNIFCQYHLGRFARKLRYEITKQIPEVRLN